MKTVGENVSLALERSNSVDDDIKAFVIKEVDRWVKLKVKTHRWDFMRTETSKAIVEADNSIDLADDYWKMYNAKLENSEGNKTPIEVKDRNAIDSVVNPTTKGTPYMCAVFGTELHFYYAADKAYTIYYTYYKTQGDLTVDKIAPFPDDIIEQIAYIFAMQYDRIDTSKQEIVLEHKLKNLRRGSEDEGVSGSEIGLDPHVFSVPPKNYI